ncbi:MAG TPA: hypothetical protein DEF05_10860 [Erwinia sp.]|nr:aquaporin [Erwinia sp.]HBV40157.1 hypothetical protein [Erwinia sp.]
MRRLVAESLGTFVLVFGGCGRRRDFSRLYGMITEAVLTTIFPIVTHRANNKPAPQGCTPIAIGLFHLVSIPITDSPVNPARSTAMAIFEGGWTLDQPWMFWAMPIVVG